MKSLCFVLFFYSFLWCQPALSQQSIIQAAFDQIGQNKPDSALLLLSQAQAYYLSVKQNDSLAYATSLKYDAYFLLDQTEQCSTAIHNSLNILSSAQDASPDLSIKIFRGAAEYFVDFGMPDSAKIYIDKIQSLVGNQDVPIDSMEVADFYLDLCYYQFGFGDLDASEKAVKRSMDYFRALDKTKTRKYAVALNRLSVVYYYQSKYSESLDLSKQNIALLEQLEESSSLTMIKAYNNLAGGLNDFENYREALEYNNKALEMSKQLIKQGNLSEGQMHNVIHTRARIYWKLNRKDRFLEEALKLEKILDAQPHIYSAYAYSNVAEYYGSEGKFKKADEYIDKAWKYYARLGNNRPDDRAQLLLSHAAIEEQKKNLGRAIELYDRSISIRDSLVEGANYYVAVPHQAIGLIYATQEDWEQAFFHLDQSFKIVKDLFEEGHHARISLYYSLADVHINRGDIVEGRTKIDQALREMRIDPNKQTDWSDVRMHLEGIEILALYLGVLEKSLENDPNDRDLTSFIKLSEIYSEYIERYVGYYDSFSAHVQLDTSIFKTYAGIIKTGFNHRERFEESDEFIYRNIQKSKTIVSRLILNDINAASFSGVPDSLLEKERQLKSELKVMSVRLEEGENREALQDLFLENERAYLNLREKFKSDYPEYYDLKYDFSIPSISLIQQNLNPKEVFLDLFVDDSVVLIISFSPDLIEVAEIDQNDQDLLVLIEQFKESVKNYASNDWEAWASRLRGRIFKDLSLQPEKVDRWYICSDGPFHGISFDALLNGEMNRFVPIHLLASSQDLVIQSDHSGDQNLLGFAPVFEQDRSHKVLPQPFSKQLAQEIALKFDASIYYEKEAKETVLKRESDKASILHLSTHGFLDENNILDSYLLLHGDSINDGYLRISEIFDLELSAHLTILNACNTSTGKFRPGAGINSLANAFSFIGSKILVSSLWDVDEKANSTILRYFYNGLKKQMPASEALAYAKSEYNRKVPDELRHPYYWSGIILIGADIQLKTGFLNNYGLFLLGGLVFLGLFYFWVRKSRSSS